MKIRIYLKLIIFFFILSLFLSACKGSGSSKSPVTDPAPENIFYVDSVSGNDENDGHTESTAWKSIDKVNSYSFDPGDEILFKRGLVFIGSMEITNSGSEAEPIIFDAYGTGDLPVLLGSREEATGWTDEGSGIYSKTISYTPGETGAGIVLEDGTPLTFKKWDTNFTISLGAETGVFTYNPNDLNTSTIYLHCSNSLAPSTHTIEAGYHLIGMHGDGVSNIRIRNLHFKQYSLHGVSIRDASNVIIRNCTAEKIGGATLVYNPLPIIYAGNGFEFTLSSMNCSIYDSTAIDIFDSGFSPQVFESNNILSNVIFGNCTTQKCGFAGIEISVLDYNGSTDEIIDDVQVLSCYVSKCGAGWSGVRYGNEGHGIRVKADYGAGSLSGISIEQTTVSNCEGAGILIAGESGTVSIHRVYISGNKGDGILCQEIDPVTTLKLKLTSSLILNQNDAALTSGIGYNVVNGNGFDIINNTFINNNISIAINVCGGSALLKNNIFYSPGFQAYLYAGSAISAGESDFNCYYEHSGNIINWAGSLYTQVSDFYNDTLLDQHSIGDNPSFVNASSDWHLQSGSTCKSTGTSAGVSVDYDGNAFDATNPSRGAYQ